MLHDLVVDSVVENNLISDNRKAGIVVHDSHNNLIRNNRVLRNNRGMRITVGSFGNLFEGNLIFENRGYSVFIYSGAHISSDDYSNIEIIGSNISRHTDGRPRRNIFRDNRIINNSKGIFVLTSEDNIFRGNTIEGNVDITIDQSQNILFSKNSFNGLANITVRGIEEQGSSVLLDAVTDASLSLDKYSNIQLLGRSQRIADFGQLSGLVNNVYPEKIILELGRSSDVLSGSLRRLPLSVKGQRPVSVRKIRWPQAHKILWHVSNKESSQEVLYTFSDLITESPYSFTKNGVTTYYLADTSGTLKVKDVLEAGTAYSYQFQLVQ
jgi:parallel beta-helix repeat protein